MADILFHSLVFSPDSVSTAYLMTDLATQLKSLGHNVTVLTTSPHYNIDKSALAQQPITPRWFGLIGHSVCNGVEVWHIKIPKKGQRVYSRVIDYVYFHLMSLFLGFFVLKKHDCIITPSPPLTIGLVGWLLGKKMRAPFVYNLQEIYPDFAINQGLIKNPLLIRFLRYVESVVYNKSTRVISISSRFNDLLVQRKVPKEKLCVIPNFVDTEFYRPMPRNNPYAVQNGLTEKFVILYAGNIGLSQDWESMMTAAREVAHLPILFAIAGDGAVSKWLRSEVKRRQLSNVKFLGYQPREMVASLYASCDICMIPMKTATTIDTFPSKIYSILACGKPVIVQADPNSELEWLVRTIRCGYVAKPDDARDFLEAVLTAYTEREALPTMGARGLELVRSHYSKAVVGRRYDELIHELVCRHAREKAYT